MLNTKQTNDSITTTNSPANTRQSQYTDRWITKYNCEGEAGNEAVEVKQKEESTLANIRLGKRWSDGIGLVKWDRMAHQYISQTTVKQNTLGGRNTDMFSNDATFRQ